VLKPYCGHDTGQRPNAKRRWFGDSPELYSRYISFYGQEDVDPKYQTNDDWSYYFNSLGYRGEEFNSYAPETIFVCGCSHTFGLGIKWEQTFGYIFRDLYCQHRGMEKKDVNLQNFSSIGASNNYIARTVITQLSCFKPSLVIVYFTSRTRKEYVKGRRVISLQPSLLSSSFATTGDDTGKVEIEASYDYYAFYTDEMGFIETLKDMLLVKCTCDHMEVPYLFVWQDVLDFKNPKFQRNPICSSYLEMLDHHTICRCTLRSMEVDKARDGNHCGPRTNEIFGQALFKFFVDEHG
jgi:hypothetical protein